MRELSVQLSLIWNVFHWILLQVSPNSGFRNEDSLEELQLQTKQLLLLARIHEKSGNIPESLKTLQRARDNQYRVHKLCTIGHVENLYEQSKILSK